MPRWSFGLDSRTWEARAGRLGDRLAALVAAERASRLSQVTLAMRIQFWPIVFTLGWVVLCAWPQQMREYYLVSIAAARDTPPDFMPAAALVLASWNVAAFVFFTAWTVSCLPSAEHLDHRRRLAARALLVLPSLLAILAALGVPAGMLLAPFRETLTAQDVPLFVGVIAAHVVVVALALVLRRKRFWGFTAGAMHAVAGRRSRAALGGLAAYWVAMLALTASSYIVFVKSATLQLDGGGEVVSFYDYSLFAGLYQVFGAALVTLTILSYLFRQVLGIPIVALLAGWAILLSALDVNDNHRIRRVTAGAAPVRAPYPQAFGAWLCARRDLTNYIARPTWCPPASQPAPSASPPASPPAGATYPVYVVAAQGGGIYAAYEAAMFLARLEDACPGFSQHVFFISSVSGGSLGAATFSGLTARNDQRARIDCMPDATRPGRMARQVESFLRRDFLSSTSSTALAVDLLQRFWPSPIPAWDRATVMEHSFELAWFGHDPVIAEPGFARFDTPPKPQQVRDFLYAQFFHIEYGMHWTPTWANPALVINTTEVESGHGVPITPFAGLAASTGLRSLRDFDEGMRIPVSTAVVLSARFPFFASAGWFERDARFPEPRKRRLVDGAYYENSGVLTALRLMWPLSGIVQSQKLPVKLVLISLGGPVQPSTPSYAFGELLSPLRAMLAAPTARGDQARANARAFMNQSRTDVAAPFREVVMDVGAHRLPLGWVMSKTSRDQIARAVGTPQCDAARRTMAEGAPPTGADVAMRQAYNQARADCIMWQITQELLGRAP